MRALRGIARAAVVCCVLAPAPASACGGFFCNAMAVDQSGERIVFAYEPDGTVTTVVWLDYVGPSPDFAWILPVVEVPEVSLGTAALFTALDGATRPRVLTGQRVEGACRDDTWCGPCGPGTICLDAGAPGPSVDEGVSVETRDALGPYEVAVLSADDPASLERWLDENGYLVAEAARPRLADYVASGHHFVALRLAKDASAGDVQPIVLRSASREPCIPLRLTAIAAVPDMPLTVYVLADRRARPLSWLLVPLDLGAVPAFWTGGAAYADLLTATVDAAGGQAFVTEYAGPTPTAQVEALVSRDELAAASSYPAMLAALGVASDDPIARRLVWQRSRSGVFDPEATADALELAVLRPRREAQAMLDAHPWVTRLGTTISPDEMTDDPTFTLSDELPPEHSRDLIATMVVECGAAYDVADAPVSLVLGDGARVRLSDGRLVPESACPYAPPPAVGGCAAAGRGGGPWWLVLLGLVRRWR